MSVKMGVGLKASIVLALLVSTSVLYADDLVIQSFDGTGHLTFNELTNATGYRVEWSSSAGGPWRNFTGAYGAWLDSIPATGSGVVTASVPMVYRVVATITNLPTTTTSSSTTSTTTSSTTTTTSSSTTTSSTTTTSTTTTTTTLAPPGMVLIPAGVNTGVDPDFGAYSLTNETSFYMDKYEVTKALWREVASWAATNGYDISAAGGSGVASDHPVQSVTWYECVKWCNARSQRDGREATYYTDAGYTSVYKTGTVSGVSAPYVKGPANGYRLPTEVEWKYAARGGATSHRFPWSDSDEIQHARANYWSSSSYSYDTSPTREHHPDYDDGGFPYTSPVGDFAANGYGVHDMAGNVWEWCYDWDPQWPYRVFRGGGWDSDADRCRVANRDDDDPGFGPNSTGFRVVLPAGQ